MEVSKNRGTPIAGWLIRENPIQKWMIWGCPQSPVDFPWDPGWMPFSSTPMRPDEQSEAAAAHEATGHGQGQEPDRWDRWKDVKGIKSERNLLVEHGWSNKKSRDRVLEAPCWRCSTQPPHRMIGVIIYFATWKYHEFTTKIRQVPSLQNLRRLQGRRSHGVAGWFTMRI